VLFIAGFALFGIASLLCGPATPNGWWVTAYWNDNGYITPPALHSALTPRWKRNGDSMPTSRC
jgi:hypothetical protein